MSTGYGEACPKCSQAPFLRFGTDLNGRLVESVIRACEHERKRRGVCKDCNNPVQGEIGNATRCGPCRQEKRRADALAYRHRHLETVRARQRPLAKRYHEQNRERILADKRERSKRDKEKLSARAKKKRVSGDPAYERAKARNRAYAEKHKERLAAQRRARYLRDRDKILAERAEIRAFRKRQAEARAKLAARTTSPEKHLLREAA